MLLFIQTIMKENNHYSFKIRKRTNIAYVKQLFIRWSLQFMTLKHVYNEFYYFYNFIINVFAYKKYLAKLKNW